MAGRNPIASSLLIFTQLATLHAVMSYKDKSTFTLLHGLAFSLNEYAGQHEQERAIMSTSEATSPPKPVYKLSNVQYRRTHAHEAGRLHMSKDSGHAVDDLPPWTHNLAQAYAHAPTSKEEQYVEAFEYRVGRNSTVALWSPHVLARPPFLAHYVPACNVVKAFEEPGYPHIDVSYADVVVFNLGQVEDLIAVGKPYLPQSKPTGQFWVAGCWEPRVYAQVGAKGDCSLLNDPVTMSFMDAVASYDIDSDFPALFTPPSFEQMRRPAPDFKANFLKLNSHASPAVASTVVSDCRVDHRNRWMKEIKDALAERGHPDAILAYGKCNRTIKERSCEDDPDDVLREEEPSSIAEVWIRRANRCMAQPFQLISENTQAPWYVTEKVWNALATGTVPVYDGPPEVKRLVPPGSVLFADDFASTGALVDAMLSFTEEDHRRARAWTQLPVSEWGGWAEARRLSRATLVPRLCEAAAERPTIQEVAAESMGVAIETPWRPSAQWLEVEQHHNGQRKALSNTFAEPRSLLASQSVMARPDGHARKQDATGWQSMRAIRPPLAEHSSS